MKKFVAGLCLLVALFSGLGSAQGAVGQWEMMPGTEDWEAQRIYPSAIWISSSGDVFVAAIVQKANWRFQESRIFHYDGVALTQMISGIPYAIEGKSSIWGSSPTDVYAVGCGSTILHYDGTEWLPVDLGIAVPWTDYAGVWGSSANDVFVVGTEQILHFDGTNWEWMTTQSGTFYDIFGFSSTNIYVTVADMDGTVLHYDGSEWSNIGAPGGGFVNELWGSSPDDMYFLTPWLITRRRPNSWTNPLSNVLAGFDGIWGSSKRDVFVGSLRSIFHFNGVKWISTSIPDTNFVGVLGGNAKEVFAGGWPKLPFLRMIRPTMEVIRPNGGEIWKRGNTYRIRWFSSELGTGKVSIRLFKEGSLLRKIALTPNDGNFAWKIPADLTAGADYQIKIILVDTKEFDLSDQNFRIR